MEQTAQRYGSRISILGLWEVDRHFDYALAQGGFKTASYLKVMNAQAKKAQRRLKQTSKITVIVQDNGSIHTSRDAKAMWPQWQEQGLFIFMLPAYCPELNDIETQWRQLKAHEIAGRMFSNEYDLACAVIEGMEARGKKGKFEVERFKFNSA